MSMSYHLLPQEVLTVYNSTKSMRPYPNNTNSQKGLRVLLKVVEHSMRSWVWIPVSSKTYIIPIAFLGRWYWGLNLGLHVYKADAVLLEPTSSLFCSGYFRDGVSRPIFPNWSPTTILLISVSQVARTAGVPVILPQLFLKEIRVIKCFLLLSVHDKICGRGSLFC
jgi:hypothetical protein